MEAMVQEWDDVSLTNGQLHRAPRSRPSTHDEGHYEVNEPGVKSTLVVIHHKHGDGTIWSVWKKIKFIEISQFRNKNLTIDTHHSRNIAPSTSYSFFLDLIRSRRNPLGSLLSVGTCLDFSVE
mmetsp:Transcript_11313/g.17220  ORF Transcript_11313/g.17220 Transcript_11313/m.17220 type:complete len:123 (+) Transcript_11313:441-809(+)